MRLLLCAVLALVVQAPPTAAPFSELEQAKLEALAQEGRALDAEQRILTMTKERWQAKVAAFKAKAEAERPGFVWNPDTGAWTAQEKK